MKTPLAFAAALFAVNLLVADTTPANTSATTVKQTDPKAAVTTTTTTPAKKDDKKPAPEPKIPGITIPRPDGTFLGLELANGVFKLSFYDKKKKPAAPDISRATARWPNLKSVTGPNRTVLNPNGNALVGGKPVLPPFTFSVHFELYRGEGEAAQKVESYDIPFRP